MKLLLVVNVIPFFFFLVKNIFLVVVVAINRIYNVCFTSFIRLIFFEGFFIFGGLFVFVGAGLWATLPPLVYLSSATTLAIDTTALLFSLFHLNKFLSENATHPKKKKVITHRCQNNHLILTPWFPLL